MAREPSKAERLEDQLRSMILSNMPASGEQDISPAAAGVRSLQRGQATPPQNHARGRANVSIAQAPANTFSPIQARTPGPRHPNDRRRTQQGMQPSFGARQSQQFPPGNASPARMSGLDISNAQIRYLQELTTLEIPRVEMTHQEYFEKEEFRVRLQNICQQAISNENSKKFSSVSLKCFGSVSSGFASRGSDMDLAIVPSDSEQTDTRFGPMELELARLLEGVFLADGIGARLITNTRVPILKICEKPTEKLFSALSEERMKWETLPEDEKYAKPVNQSEIVKRTDGSGKVHKPQNTPRVEKVHVDEKKTKLPVQTKSEVLADPANPSEVVKVTGGSGKVHAPQNASRIEKVDDDEKKTKPSAEAESEVQANDRKTGSKIGVAAKNVDNAKGIGQPDTLNQTPQPQPPRPRLRERKLGPLDFPQSGVGIQCDINFSNPLALHNTVMMRCYSLCDPRVRPMVLFVKSWAKKRKINSPYNGTLSSYGYVLMVLHFLMNVAYPPVIPNLQLPQVIRNAEVALFCHATVEGYDVRFWREEEQIRRFAAQGILTSNRQSLGLLLRNFFQYFATQGNFRSPSFRWMEDVISIRTHRGILSKKDKNWTAAKITMVDDKEIRQRYLFAIEDPFELDHNVARTVTHFGLVAIRDEFRRAWRILNAVGRGQPDEQLLAPVMEDVARPVATAVQEQTTQEEKDQGSSNPLPI